MFKFVLWTAAVSSAGAAALFVPLDPALLAAVGLGQSVNDARVAPLAAPVGAPPLKIISASARPGQKAEIKVVRGPAVSPYQAAVRDTPVSTPQRSRSATFASPAPLPIVHAPTPKPLAPVPNAVVRQLQQELRRVGCYHGRIDGDWGPASRFAMAAFTTSVNAALPTARPDIVLLTLVRRHVGVACGRNRAAPVQAAQHLVPSARVKTTQAWRIRVAPAAPRLAQRPRAAEPHVRLVETPRIVRNRGRQSQTAAFASTSANGAVATPTASGSAYRAFNDRGRMALGAIPAPQAAPPVTAARRPGLGAQSARRNVVVRPRYKRKRSVNRRRYRRRSRAQSWRRKVFPNFYN